MKDVIPTRYRGVSVFVRVEVDQVIVCAGGKMATSGQFGVFCWKQKSTLIRRMESNQPRRRRLRDNTNMTRRGSRRGRTRGHRRGHI